MTEQRPSPPTSQPSYDTCPPKDPSYDPSPPADPDPPYPDPHEKPCPEPKPCPQPPTQPCPPPQPGQCEPPPEEPCEPKPPYEPPPHNTDGKSVPTTPAQQLEKLRKDLEAGRWKLSKCESLKTSLDALEQRIHGLEKTVEGQAAANAAYTEFYRGIEVYRSEVECFIPTVRCQLDLTEKQKNCIRKAIATVDARVSKARSDLEAQNAVVRWREKKQKKLEETLAWAKKWHEFFKTGLQQQINKQREDLKGLKALADPSKDQCEVWFYLYEMDSMLRSARTTDEGEACYIEGLNLATFLDCWSPKCCAAAYQHWIVAFNEAEAAEQFGKSELAEAQKRATELDNIAKEAEAKRREWILKELKVLDCCGPKCP